MNYYDVVVIGAGPSGMMATRELIDNSNLSVCILEKGKLPSERSCNLIEKGKCINCTSCELIEGVGGAGFFSDGKLCLSNDVGERLKDRTSEFTIDKVKFIDKLLKNQGTIKPKLKEESVKIKKLARRSGLTFESYDVRAIEPENSKSLILGLKKELLENGATLLDNCCATDLSQQTDGKWTIRILKDNSNDLIHCRFLLVGVGRSGAKWLLDQARKLNIETEFTPFYLGLRVETSKNVMEPLTRLSYNPKLYMGYKNRRYVKTHCFCEGGTVVTYSYDNTKIVGGFCNGTDNSSFSILVEQKVPPNYSTYEYSHWLCGLINQIGDKKIILQRLGDFKKSKSSKEKDIKNNSIRPTLKDYALNNMSIIFPKSIIALILEFINRMDSICPGLDNDATLVYAPALEWCVDRFVTKENMETCKDNLYVMGDGSGTTQGIVAAAATGLIAAKGVISRSRS